jgi:hypothetical protein
MANVVDNIVATAGYARERVDLNRRKRSRIGVVGGALFERTRTKVAVEALAVIEWLVQLDIFGARLGTQVINVQVPEAAELGFEGAEHGVVGVAGVAGLVGRDAMVLIVGSSQIARIIDVKAFAVRLHDVAGETEGGALRTFHFVLHAYQEAEDRKKKEHTKGKNLAAGMNGNRGTKYQQASEKRAEDNQNNDGDSWHIRGNDARSYFFKERI